MNKDKLLRTVILIGITCLAVSGCAFGSSSGASPTAGRPSSTSSSNSANVSTNQPSTNSNETDTNGINMPSNEPASNENQNPDLQKPESTGAPLTIMINGKQAAPKHQVELRSGNWFFSTDDLDQIFNTYIDTSNATSVGVHLDSIVTIEFDLQQPIVTIGGTKQSMTVGAYREGSAVYLPIQTIADQCGVQVQYDVDQNQLTIHSETLHYRLPLIGDQSLQTVVLPGANQNIPAQIQDENGQTLLKTEGQQLPIVGMQFFNVGAKSPLVLLISQGGTGGQIYAAYLYDASANQFQKVPWGSDQSINPLGYVGYNADTLTIRLSQRTYDAAHHIVSTNFKWTPQSDSSVGRLEAVSTMYGPVLTSSNLDHLDQSPELVLEAALTSVSEHLPQETNLYFANSSDGTAFYEKWEPVFPFGNTVSVDLSNWSDPVAGSGKPQTVRVTTTGSKGEITQYRCTIAFLSQGNHYRIQSIELRPNTN